MQKMALDGPSFFALFADLDVDSKRCTAVLPFDGWLLFLNKLVGEKMFWKRLFGCLSNKKTLGLHVKTLRFE